MENNIFYSDRLTVYYPAGNNTWPKDLLLNYGGTVSWIAGKPPAQTLLFFRKEEY